jgi:hypothetical protein
MAIVLVLVMAGYFVVTNHVRLPPFNNLSPERPQLMSTVVGTFPALLVVLALLADRGLLIAASWLWVWLLLQVTYGDPMEPATSDNPDILVNLESSSESVGTALHS